MGQDSSTNLSKLHTVWKILIWEKIIILSSHGNFHLGSSLFASVRDVHKERSMFPNAINKKQDNLRFYRGHMKYLII